MLAPGGPNEAVLGEDWSIERPGDEHPIAETEPIAATTANHESFCIVCTPSKTT